MTTKSRFLNMRIPDDIKDRLDAESARTGAPIAEITRRALDACLTQEGVTPLEITGAWYMDTLPAHMVIELAHGEGLRLAPITPLAPISRERLAVYRGYHPAECASQPVPERLHRFYGLSKVEESAK